MYDLHIHYSTVGANGSQGPRGSTGATGSVCLDRPIGPVGCTLDLDEAQEQLIPMESAALLAPPDLLDLQDMLVCGQMLLNFKNNFTCNPGHRSQTIIYEIRGISSEFTFPQNSLALLGRLKPLDHVALADLL